MPACPKLRLRVEKYGHSSSGTEWQIASATGEELPDQTDQLRVPYRAAADPPRMKPHASRYPGEKPGPIFPSPPLRKGVGVDGPRRHRMCQTVNVVNTDKGAVRMTIIRIGLDTSKHVFQTHGVDESEKPVLRRQLRRSEMAKFFTKLPPTRIGLEACGAAHHWARLLRGVGHEVLLMPPQYIKPYVKRSKNDAIDAEAICEAMSRPTMRFVAVKSADSQAALTMLKVRDLLVKQRTM